RFSSWPGLLAGLLFVIEFGSGRFLNRASLALAGYAVGAVIPLFHWDEVLHLKFADISVKANKFTVTFSDEDRKRFAQMKEICFAVFALGLIVLFANLGKL